MPDTPPEPRCPFCGLSPEEHDRMQEIANSLRTMDGLPPLDPPDIHIGYQRRD